MNNTQFWFLKWDSKYYRNKWKEDATFDYHSAELNYDYDKKLWCNRDEYTGNVFPSSIRCRSYKAALRHLRKHTEIPVGTHFVLVARYVGQPNRHLVKKR